MTTIVIGGGLVGMGVALALRRRAPGINIEILEKEPMVGRHQSTHNSGVLHAGLYYKPGSLKAKLAVEGIRRMTAFCEEHDIAHEICGKVVVATTPAEILRLKELVQRGLDNGLKGIDWLTKEALREIEPHAAGLAAVHVPEEGIVDYGAVCSKLAQVLRENEVTITTRAEVLDIRRMGTAWYLETTRGEREADFVINCAGLYSDKVAEMAGEKRDTRIVPFRGEYYHLKSSAQHLVKNLIYPVPDPSFPFLGVHFTRMIQGGVEAGPNAVLAYSREGYKKSDIYFPEFLDAVAYKGLWSFLRKHKGMAWEEMKRSFSKRLFCASLQKLVPAITEKDIEPGGSGVRAQAMERDGTLVQDFRLKEGEGILHVLNAPSPAATASLAIGDYISSQVIRRPSFEEYVRNWR